MASNKQLWVAVIDGENARIVVPAEAAGRYRTARSWTSATAHQRSQRTDAPGRSYESANVARHAIQPRHDPHVLAKQRFVADVAREIDEAAAQDAFDRLVLVAPSTVLQELRAALSAQSAGRIVGVLQKDLVKVPDQDIGSHLTWDVLHAGA